MLHTLAETAELISSGKLLLIHGDGELLGQLPQGQWVGGTIHYFMATDGGLQTRDKLFVTELPALGEVQIRTYTAEGLAQVYEDSPANSWNYILIPAFAEVHQRFALEGPNYPGFGTRPLIGWISGMHLDDVGQVSAKVYAGPQGEVFEDQAVVLNMTLPADKIADIDIVNIFEPGEGDTIEFLEDGFQATEVLINGEKENFAAYVSESGLDTQLPLVANYGGACVNVSFQAVHAEEQRVDLYAPVFRGMQYKHAKPVDDYATRFTAALPQETGEGVLFSCNCILNYLYSGFEGNKIGTLTGPTTFGEIAYQLLNQTLTYLRVSDAD